MHKYKELYSAVYITSHASLLPQSNPRLRYKHLTVIQGGIGDDVAGVYRGLDSSQFNKHKVFACGLFERDPLVSTRTSTPSTPYSPYLRLPAGRQVRTPSQLPLRPHMTLARNPDTCSSVELIPPEDAIQRCTARVPCRDGPISKTATLLWPWFPSPSTTVIHGSAGTGKTLAVRALLTELQSAVDEALSYGSSTTQSSPAYAYIDCRECLTVRHLSLRISTELQEAADVVATDRSNPGGTRANGRDRPSSTTSHYTQIDDDSLSVGRLQSLLRRRPNSAGRFTLVLDHADSQREINRSFLLTLSEMVSQIPNLSLSLVLNSASAPTKLASYPHLYFPIYTKEQILHIVDIRYPLTLKDPSGPSPVQPQDRASDDHFVFTRFLSALWDSLGSSTAATLPAFLRLVRALYPTFVSPIASGQVGPRDFTRLLVRQRGLFQSEAILLPSIHLGPTALVDDEDDEVSDGEDEHYEQDSSAALTIQSELSLAPTALLLLTAAYLASHTPPRRDITHFSGTSDPGRRRRRGGRPVRTQKRKLSGSADMKSNASLVSGPVSSTLERLFAIFHALVRNLEDDDANRSGLMAEAGAVASVGRADVQSQFAQLAALRLVNRAGHTAVAVAHASGLDGIAMGKWRINAAVDYNMIRGAGRKVGVEVEDYVDE